MYVSLFFWEGKDIHENTCNKHAEKNNGKNWTKIVMNVPDQTQINKSKLRSDKCIFKQHTG